MIYCSKCGAENKESSKYCHSCGAPIAQGSYRSNRNLLNQLSPPNQSRPPFSAGLEIEPEPKSGTNKVLIALLIVLVTIIVCGCLIFIFRSNNDSSQAQSNPLLDDTQQQVQPQDYLEVENSSLELALESGSAWEKDVPEGTTTGIASVSFNDGYYSVALANGQRISGDYTFVQLPQEGAEGVEEEDSEAIQASVDPNSSLVLFEDLSEKGDALVMVSIKEIEDGSALSLVFNNDPVSQSASQELGFNASDVLLNQSSFQEVQSQNKAAEQQAKRQQEAEKRKQVYNTSEVSTPAKTPQALIQPESNSSSSSQAQIVNWGPSKNFVHRAIVGDFAASLQVQEDGSFILVGTDSNAGQKDYSVATGKFSQPARIDNYRCAVNVESINFQAGQLPSGLSIDPNIEYRNSDITQDFPDSLILYLPGTPVSQIEISNRRLLYSVENQSNLDNMLLSDGNRYVFFTA